MARPRLLPTLARLLLVLPAVASPAGPEQSHFECRVTDIESLAGLAPLSAAAELTRFTCRVRGGLLDGFVATGTNIWDGKMQDGVLLGSLVVARKAGSVVVYEVTQVTRLAQPDDAADGQWEGRGAGVYKLGTGSAAALAGKSFRSVARSTGAGTFTIDTTVDD